MRKLKETCRTQYKGYANFTQTFLTVSSHFPYIFLKIWELLLWINTYFYSHCTNFYHIAGHNSEESWVKNISMWKLTMSRLHALFQKWIKSVLYLLIMYDFPFLFLELKIMPQQLSLPWWFFLLSKQFRTQMSTKTWHFTSIVFKHSLPQTSCSVPWRHLLMFSHNQWWVQLLLVWSCFDFRFAPS